MALVTLPERMHLVQTFFLRTVPFSSTFTVWILAFHFLFVCLLEWLTLLPETWPLPQISHFLDISYTSLDCFLTYVMLESVSIRRTIDIITQDNCSVKQFFTISKEIYL